jgi:hypothetical protein
VQALYSLPCLLSVLSYFEATGANGFRGELLLALGSGIGVLFPQRNSRVPYRAACLSSAVTFVVLLIVS